MTRRTKPKSTKSRKASIPLQYRRHGYQPSQPKNNTRVILLTGLVLALVTLLLAQNGWLEGVGILGT